MPKNLPDIKNFGEYLYYAYANLQMLYNRKSKLHQLLILLYMHQSASC